MKQAEWKKFMKLQKLKEQGAYKYLVIDEW